MDKRYAFLSIIYILNKKIPLIFSIGPILPFNYYYRLSGSTMVSSPIEKGVVVIGGINQGDNYSSNCLFELSGDSIESLKWKKLDQKLQYSRNGHVSFLISDTCNPYLNSEPMTKSSSTNENEIPDLRHYCTVI